MSSNNINKKTTSKIETFIASNTQFSRRETEKLIKEKRVTVNGIVFTKFGQKISPTQDVIKVDGKPVKNTPQKKYYLFHKPKGILSTMSDPKNRPNLKPLLEKIHPSIFPVGRLDRQTTGLLICTNDGDFANKLLHPKHQISKVYKVSLDKPITKMDCKRLEAGMILEDGPVRFLAHQLISDTSLVVEISEGRNRIIRRAFEFLGYTVKKLHRLSVGPWEIGDLKEGAYKSFVPGKKMVAATGIEPVTPRV